ncbi:DM13 domain-containing protein [Streptomyces sp.]|uniref:DM13 domain-containing protein n=1 Tax=Streptomyces sp. TaxID=1931 RepID=UPI002D5AD5D7|nr:DM13 domain-containing protein [Streptomyces sp.]HZF89109.1 DM13 domain-containing protein [Streptomyces sp.]
MGRVWSVLVRPWVIGVLVMGLAGAAFGLYWFQPWKLWQEETVHEALPEAAAPSAPPAARPSGRSAAPAPAGPVTLASGELISHEHATSGTVKLVRLADGSRIVRLENLDTSNGPDLRVWLSDAEVKEGQEGWHLFDDGEYVSLGRLKGNKGSQNYTVPADVDLSRYSSVSIWCDRFDVSFGAAELARA